MRTRKLMVWAGTAVSLLCAATSQGAIFSNFEPPTYTANTVVTNFDGWTGGGNAVVTPYPAGEPYGSAVLEGTQSLWMLIDFERRSWSNSVIPSLINTNDTYVSWLMERPKGFGRSLLYLWDIPAGVNTPAGLGMGTNGNFEVFGKDVGTSLAVSDTGVGYDTNKVYRLGMLFDFTNNTFTAFSENVTDSGPRLNMGTYLTYHVGSWDINSLRTNGGLWLQDYNTTATLPLTASIWDDIQVVPEPTSLLLVVLGGLPASLTSRRRSNGVAE
jgi:hypothetical protein